MKEIRHVQRLLNRSLPEEKRNALPEEKINEILASQLAGAPPNIHVKLMMGRDKLDISPLIQSGYYSVLNTLHRYLMLPEGTLLAMLEHRAQPENRNDTTLAICKPLLNLMTLQLPLTSAAHYNDLDFVSLVLEKFCGNKFNNHPARDQAVNQIMRASNQRHNLDVAGVTYDFFCELNSIFQVVMRLYPKPAMYAELTKYQFAVRNYMESIIIDSLACTRDEYHTRYNVDVGVYHLISQYAECSKYKINMEYDPQEYYSSGYTNVRTLQQAICCNNLPAAQGALRKILNNQRYAPHQKLQQYISLAPARRNRYMPILKLFSQHTETMPLYKTVINYAVDHQMIKLVCDLFTENSLAHILERAATCDNAAIVDDISRHPQLQPSLLNSHIATWANTIEINSSVNNKHYAAICYDLLLTADDYGAADKLVTHLESQRNVNFVAEHCSNTLIHYKLPTAIKRLIPATIKRLISDYARATKHPIIWNELRPAQPQLHALQTAINKNNLAAASNCLIKLQDSPIITSCSYALGDEICLFPAVLHANAKMLALLLIYEHTTTSWSPSRLALNFGIMSYAVEQWQQHQNPQTFNICKLLICSNLLTDSYDYQTANRKMELYTIENAAGKPLLKLFQQKNHRTLATDIQTIIGDLYPDDNHLTSSVALGPRLV